MNHRSVAVAAFVLAVTVVAPALARAEGQVERGMKVFTDSKCSMCHSVGGKETPKACSTT